jgi:hypothetical protein
MPNANRPNLLFVEPTAKIVGYGQHVRQVIFKFERNGKEGLIIVEHMTKPLAQIFPTSE